MTPQDHDIILAAMETLNADLGIEMKDWLQGLVILCSIAGRMGGLFKVSSSVEAWWGKQG